MIKAWSHATCDAGFTLLELLVVLAVLALVGAVTMPALLSPSDSVRLQSAANGVLAALQRARSAAIVRNRDTSVLVDVDKRTLQPTAGQPLRFDPDISLHLIVAEPERATSSRAGFRFYPDGSSTGGSITLKLQERTIDLCVDWLTGRAQLGRQC